MPVWNLETELIPAGRAIFNLSEHDVKAKVEEVGANTKTCAAEDQRRK